VNHDSTVCFVTGAGGFLGRALVAALLSQGHRVRALDVRFPPEWPDAAERLEGDVCDVGLIEAGCRGATFVFHLAALLPQRHAHPVEMRRVNIDGPRGVLEAAASAGVRRVVMLSSAEVYGLPRTVPCPEEAPPNPLGEYGRNKVEAERLAREAHRRGLDVVILRCPTIVGPTMTDAVLLGTLEALRRGRPIVVPGGRERFQMVAVSDMVRASLAAARAENVAGEVFNIGAEEVPPQVEVFRELRNRISSRSVVIPLPRALFRTGLQVLSAVGRSPLEPEHVPIVLGDYLLDTRKAREQLGWRPEKGNVEALEETCRWLATE
jgi:nucleoside-diphosphate-sugar epimerase